jgi:hypothetical protein
MFALNLKHHAYMKKVGVSPPLGKRRMVAERLREIKHAFLARGEPNYFCLA